MSSRIAIAPNALLNAFKQSKQAEVSLLNQNESENALSFLTLPHPRTSHPTLFIHVKDSSSSSDGNGSSQILEVQAVDPPAPRSWFIDDAVLEDGRLLMMTSIDPVFLMLPILGTIAPAEGSGNFRTLDDIFGLAVASLCKADKEVNPSPGAPQKSIKALDINELLPLEFIPPTMRRICDIQDLGEHTVYRFSLPQTIQLLRQKVAHLSSPGVVSRTRSMARALARDGLGPDEPVEETLREAGRLKLSCEILSQYLPPSIYEALLKSYDFGSLDAYVRTIRAEDTPTASTTKDTNSAAAGASKKRKAETQVSRGAQKLMKTDTSKMTKLTSFFGKKPEPKK